MDTVSPPLPKNRFYVPHSLGIANLIWIESTMRILRHAAWKSDIAKLNTQGLAQEIQQKLEYIMDHSSDLMSREETEDLDRRLRTLKFSMGALGYDTEMFNGFEQRIKEYIKEFDELMPTCRGR